MIMETEEHAKARGAEIYAEVLGGALTGDAYHLTAPDPSADGASRAIRKALRYSDVAAEDVDVILAHGTGTELNDEVEALAIRQVFGQPTPKTTSIKCMVGHALGAAGAESALAAVMAIRENTIPPTINYTEDPALGVDVVGNESLSYPVRLAIVNAFGFGGQNVVAVFGEYDG